MKILYIITKAELGGASSHVFLLSKKMQEKGHNVGLLCKPNEWLSDEFKNISSNFFENNFFDNSFNIIKFIKSFFITLKTIRKFDPDIIACHSSMAGVVGRLASIFHKKSKVVFTAHSWAFTPGSPLYRIILMIPVERFLSFLTDKIICVSNFDLKIARKYKIASNKKLITIYNGVEDRNIRKNFLKDKFKIISISRLDYPKLPELLIESFSILNAENIELYIIGNGKKFNKLKSLINKLNLQNKIFLLGSIENNKIFSILEDSDLYILLSKHEGLPISILEAMSVGLPIIASNVGGIPEELDPNFGILVSNNKFSVKDAIEFFIKNKKDINLLSKFAFEKQRRVFSIEKCFHDTEILYKSLIN